KSRHRDSSPATVFAKYFCEALIQAFNSVCPFSSSKADARSLYGHHRETAVGKVAAMYFAMPEYSDPEKSYTISYPDGWLPLTHEGSPHVSLASLTTGGYLKVEACQFEKAVPEAMRPDRALQSLVDCEKRSWPQIEEPVIQRGSRNGSALAYMTYTRTEPQDDDHLADFGPTRAWIF